MKILFSDLLLIKITVIDITNEKMYDFLVFQILILLVSSQECNLYFVVTGQLEVLQQMVGNESEQVTYHVKW